MRIFSLLCFSAAWVFLFLFFLHDFAFAQQDQNFSVCAFSSLARSPGNTSSGVGATCLLRYGSLLIASVYVLGVNKSDTVDFYSYTGMPNSRIKNGVLSSCYTSVSSLSTRCDYSGYYPEYGEGIYIPTSYSSSDCSSNVSNGAYFDVIGQPHWNCTGYTHLYKEGSADAVCCATFTVSGVNCSGADANNPILCPQNNPPSCSDPFPVSNPYCKGGMGLWGFVDSSIPGFDYGVIENDNTYISCTSPPLTRPDGSECSFSEVPDQPCTWVSVGTFCPAGLTCDDPAEADNPICQPSSSSSEEDVSSSSGSSAASCDDPWHFENDPACLCRREPSHPSCLVIDYCRDFPDSEVCGGSSGGGPSSSSSPAICELFPTLLICDPFGDNGSSSGSGGDSGGDNGGDGGGGDNSGGGSRPGICVVYPNYPGCSSSSGDGPGDEPGGGTCTDFSNCDWAKLDVQLAQLGVDVESRDLVRSVLEEMRNYRTISGYQAGVIAEEIRGLNASMASGSQDIVGAINSLSGLLGGDGSGDACLDGSPPPCGGTSGGGEGGDNPGGGNGEGGDCDGVYGFLKSVFTSDCGGGSGVSCEGEDCYGGNGLDTSGFGGKADALIHGGGRGFSPYTEQQIGSLIPIPSGGQCPVVSGDVGMGGRKARVSFDFNSLAPGSPVNLALFVKTVLLATVYFINVFTMIAIFRSGGKK